MFIDKYRDTISSLVMLIVAVGYLVGSTQIRSYGDAAVDSRFFPQILGTLLALLAVVQLVMSVRNLKKVREEEEAEPGEDAPTRFNYKVVLTLAIILAYILAIQPLGFIVSSTVFLVLQTLVMAPKGQWRPVLTVVVSALFSVAIYAIFVYGFSLVLPESLLLNSIWHAFTP